MHGFAKFALHRVPSFVVICLVSLARLCVAQVEANAPGPLTRGGGGVFAPTALLELTVPVQDRIDLTFYGFYVGELKAPAAQLDVFIRPTKFLTITPSYLYYAIPKSGLNKIASPPRISTRTFEENQFRISGTLKFHTHKFEISDRSMYVRRFLTNVEINRYRNRVAIDRPLSVKGHIWDPYAQYEAYYDWGAGGWNKNRVWTGVTVPLKKHVSLQPSFLWETSKGIKDINYLLLGVIFNTK